MSTAMLTYLFIGTTFALYIGIAIWSKAGSTKEYYVAGKGVHPVANGMATGADWMSAASFISMAGIISFIGRDGAVYCVMIFAFMVPAIFISMMITGNPIPQLGFGSEVSGTGMSVLEKLNGLSAELGFDQYTSGSKSTIDVFFITMALMVGTAGLPHVIVRFFTTPTVRDARKSAGYALLFIAILYTTAPTAGAAIAGKPGFTDERGEHGQRLVNNTATDNANELYVDRDIMVLANPEIAQLPAWVIALIAAGGLAAALSTAAGLLLVISTSISHDLLKKNLMPGITDKQELLAARLAAAVAVVVAGLFGIYPPGFVAQVVAFAFGLAASSFFPAILLGIWLKIFAFPAALAHRLKKVSPAVRLMV